MDNILFVIKRLYFCKNSLLSEIRPITFLFQIYDEEQEALYSPHKDWNVWYTFDDSHTVKTKVAYAKQLGLAGAALFNLESDDSAGKCAAEKNRKYPIANAIKTVFY